MATTKTMATAIARWAAARRDTTMTTMATGDDDNDLDGDGATGNKVDDDGDGATGDDNDDDDDGHGDGAMGSGGTGYDDDDDDDGRRQRR